MSGAWTFENALHQLQYELVKTWQDKFRGDQNIAVSIQLRDEIQDRARACTASTGSTSGAPKAINGYCQRILDEQWTGTGRTFECDQLDFCLKRRYGQGKQQDLGTPFLGRFSCRCHAGVSNILVPVTHADGDVWYIFFGQFLLKDEDAKIQSAIMSAREIKPVTSISSTEAQGGRQFLQENVFITEALYKSQFMGNISLVSLPEFLVFMDYVLNKVEAFLTEVSVSAPKRRSLELYKQQRNTSALLILIDALGKEISGSRDLQQADRQILFHKLADMARDARMLTEEETVTHIEWVQSGLNAEITNRSWRNGPSWMKTRT